MIIIIKGLLESYCGEFLSLSRPYSHACQHHSFSAALQSTYYEKGGELT